MAATEGMTVLHDLRGKKGRERRRTEGGRKEARGDVRIGAPLPQGDLPEALDETSCVFARSAYALVACATE